MWISRKTMLRETTSYQATLPQGRKAADGFKPRHGRGDRKRERSFSGLSPTTLDLKIEETGQKKFERVMQRKTEKLRRP